MIVSFSIPSVISFQIGFYFNVCSDKAWYDTSLRLPQNLCCDPEKGKADPTFRSCKDFDENGKLKQ